MPGSVASLTRPFREGGARNADVRVSPSRAVSSGAPFSFDARIFPSDPSAHLPAAAVTASGGSAARAEAQAAAHGRVGSGAAPSHEADEEPMGRYKFHSGRTPAEDAAEDAKDIEEALGSGAEENPGMPATLR